MKTNTEYLQHFGAVRRLLVAAMASVVTIALSLGLSGCSQSAIALHVGDCFTASDATLLGKEPLTAVDVVDCQKKHNSEVIGVKVLEDGPFPSQEELSQTTTEFCQDAFEKYVGIELKNSSYELYPLAPSAHSWESAQDRMITCVGLVLPPTQGSMKDTKQ